MRLAQKLLLRWVANILGLWIAARWLNGLDFGDNFLTIVAAAVFLSFINSLIKPLVVMLSLPAIVFSLGLFLILINGFMIWLTVWVVDGLSEGSVFLEGFGTAVLAALIVGLVNYVVTVFIEKRL